MSLKQRIDAFDTHLYMTILWAVVGFPLIFIISRNIVDFIILFMSLYAILGTHWTAHIAWKAERAAEHDV